MYPNKPDMPEKPKKHLNLWQELKRRKVHRVLAIYAGTAFIFLEAVDIMFPRLGLPDWTVNLVMYLLIIGAIITVILSWIYDITPGGIVKTETLDSHELDVETSDKAQKRQKTSNIIIAILIVVVGILLYPKIFKGDSSPLSGNNRNTIAVLPLKVIGDDIEMNYLALGLVETLTYKLTKYGNSNQKLSVIPASDIVEQLSAIDARRQLGASLIISGSIQMENRITRIILNLIDTKKEQILESEKIEYQKEDNFNLQDEAISVMINMLSLQEDQQLVEILGQGGSNSQIANEYYLRAKGSLRNAASLKDFDVPINLFRKAIEQDSLFALAYAGLGRAIWLKYKYTRNTKDAYDAIEQMDKASRLSDKNPEILSIMGTIESDRGEFGKANQYLLKALELEPNNAGLCTNIGFNYHHQRDFEKAEEYFKRAVSLKPDYWRTYYGLGYHYYYLGDYVNAIEQYNKSLEIAPENQTVLNALGGCYWHIQDIDNAKSVWERIIEINPDNTLVLVNLGTIYFYEDKFDEAANYYKQALELTPNNYIYLSFLAESYLRAGRVDEAKGYYRKSINYALSNLELDHEANLQIALSYAVLEDPDSAMYYLFRSEILEDSGNVDTHTAMTVGEIFVLLGNFKQAIKWIELVLDMGYSWLEISNNPLFDEISKDTCFQSLMHEYKTLHSKAKDQG